MASSGLEVPVASETGVLCIDEREKIIRAGREPLLLQPIDWA